MRHHLTALALTASILTVPAAAQAAQRSYTPKPHARCRAGYHRTTVRVKKRIRRHHRWVVVRRHGRVVYVRQARCVRKPKPAAKPTTKQSTAAAAPTVAPAVKPATTRPAAAPRAIPSVVTTSGVGGITGDCAATTTKIERIILYTPTGIDRWLSCAQNAVASGHQLIVTVAYEASWSIAQDKTHFRQALAMYGPLHPIEISVGNEEELWGETASHYAAVWGAVEPIIAADAPDALRGAGEISPWGLSFLQNIAAQGLPGVQVLTGHVYPDAGHGFDPEALGVLADAHHVRAWATEGMCGDGAWMAYGCRPAGELQRDGMSLGVVWRAA